jgi:hypothetical protein
MKKDNCCKEKSFIYKVKDNHNPAEKYTWLKPVKINETEFTHTLSINCNPYEFQKAYLFSDGPPGGLSNPAYLLNRVFRI